MPGIDSTRLRQQLSLASVLELLGFAAMRRRGPEVRGRCPVHGSKRPNSHSFAAHRQKNCWRCFGCGAGGNALDLYAAARQLPIYQAAPELCRRLHLPVPWLPGPAWRSPP